MILANYSQLNRPNGSQLGNAFTNPFQNFRPESFMRFYCPDEANTSAFTGRDKSAFNNGYAIVREGGAAWQLSPKAGGLSTCNQIAGTGSLSASLTKGINIAANLSGSGSLGTPSLSMIVQMAAALTGTGAITAALQARLQMAAALTGSGSVTAGLSILAQLTSSLSGSGSVTANLKGKLSMSADIYVNQSQASAEQIAVAVWDAICEGNYSHSDILKILSAVAAGKTDITGSTVTFRDVNDTANRVTASMTGSERTSVTLNTD